MDDEVIQYRITARGEVFGMQILLPAYQNIVMWAVENPGKGLNDYLENLEKVLDRAVRRASENEDGTLSAQDCIELGQMKEMYENFKQKRV